MAKRKRSKKLNIPFLMLTPPELQKLATRAERHLRVIRKAMRLMEAITNQLAMAARGQAFEKQAEYEQNTFEERQRKIAQGELPF